MLAPGRLTLLRAQAGPLAGDHDRVEIRVESGTLTIEPVAATVALPGPQRTVLELDIDVGEGAHLVLEDAPLVVAAGANVVRTTTIRVSAGATAVVRDLVVLGRAGEGPGRLESVLRAEGPDGVILHDALRIDPAHDDAYVALAPGHRAVGTVAWLRGRDVGADVAAGGGDSAAGARGAADAGGVRRSAAGAGGGAADRSGVAGGAANLSGVAGGALAAGGWLWRASAVSAADVVARLAAIR